MWMPLLYFTFNIEKTHKKSVLLRSNHQRKYKGTIAIFVSQICVHMMLILLVINGKVGFLNYSMTSMEI
jgi:hypothetical protein